MVRSRESSLRRFDQSGYSSRYYRCCTNVLDPYTEEVLIAPVLCFKHDSARSSLPRNRVHKPSKIGFRLSRGGKLKGYGYGERLRMLPCVARTTVIWTSARSSGSIALCTRRDGFSGSAPSVPTTERRNRGSPRKSS